MPITFLDEEGDFAPQTTPPKRKVTFLDEEEYVPKSYSFDESRFAPKQESIVSQREIGTVEGISNAARNAFDSSRQALDIVGGVTPDEAKNIAKIEFDKESRKLAPGYDEYLKAEGMDAVWAFAKNPIEVTSNIVAEGLAGSLPALGVGLAAGGVGAAAGSVVPIIGTGAGFTAGQVAGTFTGSLATEYGSKILEEMQGSGVDLTKPESIQGFFENEELVAQARDKAIKRGVPVAAFDAISAGIGGKLSRVIGKQFLTKTGEAAAELGVQAGLGGAGEVAGAISAGEEIEPKAVFAEIIGEAGPGSVEVIAGRMADRSARIKAAEDAKIKAAAELSENLEQNNAPLTSAVIKSQAAASIEQDKLAAQLDEQLDASEIEAQVKEVAEVVGGPAITPVTPTVTPTVTPEVTPAVPTAQPTITDATQEIIQPEIVREEPQDRTQIGATEEAGVSDSLLGATRSEEERQVARDIVAELQAVANNTATREQIARLSMDGLVDVRRGQAIINEDGEGILAQAQAELPKLTPEERAAEVEATPRPLPTDALPTETPGAEYGRESELFDVFAGVRRRPLDVTEPTTIVEQEQVAPTTPVAEAPAVTPVPAPEVAPAIEPLTEEQAETIRDVITLRKSQGREPNPEQVKRLAEYDARKAGVEVQAGDIISNIVVGHPLFEAPQPELQNLIPIKVQNKEQLASSISRTEEVRNAAQTYIGQYQAEQTKAKTAAQKKALAKKFNKSELDRQRDILDYINNDVMPELDRMEKAAPSAPAPAPVTEAVTPAAPAPEVAPATQESFGQRMLNAINEKIAQGKDVFISTMTKSTKVNKKAVDNWNKAGRPLFKVGKDGNLYIGSGKRYDQLTSADMSLVGFSSEGKKLVVAEPTPTEEAVTPPVEPTAAVEPAPIEPVAKAPAVAPVPEVSPSTEQEELVGKKLFDAMGTLPQKANKARQALPGYTPVFKIGDFYDFVGEDAGLSGSTVVGTGKTARSSLPYYQSSNLQEIANRTGKPIAIIEKTAVSQIIQPTPVTTPPVTEAPTPAAPTPTAPEVAPAPTEFEFAKEIEAPRENIKKNMIRFASGMSAIGDLKTGTYARGGFKNYGVGFDVGLLSKNAIDSLANSVINLDTQVFIDSGAFSNFRKSIKEQAKGRTVEALDFDKIFEKYDSIVDAINKANPEERTDYPRPLMVMPDIIGDQKASLDLIERYKDRIAVDIGIQTFTPIIPIPLGELSLSQAYNRILEILNSNTRGVEVDPTNFIVGIPSNAKAVSKEDLAKFLRESKPPRIHFLGAAADRNITPLIETVAQNSPETAVTADASKVRSAILNGVAKGKTRKQAIFDALYQEDDPEVILNKVSEETSKQAPTPAASTTVATLPTSEPEGISVGNRIKLGKSPQTYTIEEVIPQTEAQKELGKQYYSVRNEKTGEVQTVEAKDLKPVKAKGVRKMAAAPSKQLSASLESGDFASAQAMVDQGVGMDRSIFLRSITPSATQRATTIHTRLEKDGVISKDEFSGGRGLVYGDGRGAASAYLGSQSYEPFPPAGFSPDYTGDRVSGQGDAINKKFNTILNTFVLNVVDPQTRSFIVKDIGNLLQNGGRAVFVTRGADVANSKALVSFGPLERIQRSEGKLTYQKGFTQPELIQYIKETLGEGFTVRALRGGNKSDVRVEVIKNTETTLDNPPITSPDIRRAAATRVKDESLVVPEADRYTFEQAEAEARKLFGGMPEGFIIVNDSVDPDYEFKAGYEPETGDIILNLAYIRQGESVRNLIAHELGHYAAGDPQIRAKLQEFLDALPAATRAKLERFVERVYNDETGDVRLEEKQVRAFVQMLKAGDQRNAFQKILDAIKKWLNDKLGTNFQPTDMDAAAVLSGAINRFKAGEFVAREDGEMRKDTEISQMDAEYLDAVERGDMETAQRMVDEAAKRAGYTVDGWHRTDADFTIFKPSPDSQMIYFGLDEKGVDAFLGRYAGRKVKAYLRSAKPLNTKDTPIPYREADRNRPLENTDYDSVFVSDETGVSIAVKDPSQIKLADPATYDDAGNIIPLSQRFQPTQKDIRYAKPERKEQVGGAEREETKVITTPNGILRMTSDAIRQKIFDGTNVSPENTTQAWNFISRLLDIKSGNAAEFAGQVNDVVDLELTNQREAAIAAGEQVDLEEDVNKRIGAAMFSVELMNYAGRLAEQGDTKMLRFMIRNVNSMPVDNRPTTISDAARALRTRLEYDVSGFSAYTNEQKGKVDRTAAEMFGTNRPTKDQVDAVRGAITESENTEIGNSEEVASDIEKVEKRTGKNVVKKLEEKIKTSTAPKEEELLISFQNLNQDRKVAGVSVVYKPQKIDPAKNIQNIIVGKLVDYRKTLIKQGADGLESTFWQTMSNQERKPGPLGEIDQAQNNELAKIVQKTLIDLGLKGEPPNTKMSDIEKVASILNKQLLGEEKKIAADKKIVEEIERRRASELETSADPEAVNAKYDSILDAWNQAMSRQLNMPISDNMLQRLINAELKEQNVRLSDLVNQEDGRVVSDTKQGIIDSIIKKLYRVSKEAETGVEVEEGYDAVKRYLEQTLNNMYSLQLEKKNAAYARRQAERSLRNGAEAQAQAIINRLADELSDTPSFPAKQENQIKSIVQQDLRQIPDMKRKQPWTSQLTAKLIQAGASEAQAQTIADLVWRQHEIKHMDRKLNELKTAAEKGSLAVIIKRIKNTPLEKQQSEGWAKEVIKEYLMDAGLSSEAADTAAKLYDSVISERLAAARQKVFEDTIKKSAPWKDYSSRNGRLAKNALEKIKVAIRAGVLDPENNVESIIAAQSGWSGFSKEQYQKIVQLDSVINDPKNDDLTRREAMAELNKIISKAKIPVKFKDALGAYYVGNALMGIPTLTVNIASPLGFSVRNLITDIGRYGLTNPSRIPIALQAFMDSMRSWYGNVSYSFRSEIYPNDVIEYLQGQNVLSELYEKGKEQWAKGDYANGMGNMLVGMTKITGRVLSALDQGSIAMLENQGLTRYAIEALSSQSSIPKDQINALGQAIISIRNKSIAQNVANGMPKDRAIVLADLAARSELIYALSKEGIDPNDVLNAALNDAFQSVGRNRTLTVKGLEKEQNDLSDSGTFTRFPIQFLEKISSLAANSGPGMQVFAKMLYGFALVPARVFSNVAWFSPIGAYRLAVDAFSKRMGWKSPYAMSLQTDVQYSQRLTETIAGSVVMLGLAGLRDSSADEDDEDKGFRIVITGNGPTATTDKQYYDSWHKKWKPYSIHIVMDGNIIPINIGRGGEALFFPVMLAGALDDLDIKKKQNLTKKTPEDLVDAAEVLGSAFFALAQRGPYAAFTKPLFDASKQGRVTEEIVSQAGYFGKTFIPVVGSSLSRNISDFLNDPVDRSSIEGAIYANTPIVGPWMGTKALNALGQPIRADDWGDRLFKLGVPVVFSFPKNTPENELNELILKQGSGPTIPTRANAQKRVGDIITDKEFEAYVKEYGRVMSKKMFANRIKLARMNPNDYDEELEKYARGTSESIGASESAALAVKRMRQ